MNYEKRESLNVIEDKNMARQKFLRDIKDLLGEVADELDRAMSNWAPMNSAHEGWAVIMEELDELWEHVKTNQKRRVLFDMKKEAIQVAAMACRFALEVCNEERGRR